MNEPKIDLVTRLTELVGQHGHQWKKIAPIIAEEGYRDGRGNPYTDNYLRQRMKRQEMAGAQDYSKPSEVSKPRHSSDGEPSELPIIGVPELAQAVVSLLQQGGLLQSAIKKALGNVERNPLDSAFDLPPQPDRATDRRWEKLAGTCDRELVRLFHDKRRGLRLSVSQMLDYVLWNFFGKPRLSFQSKGSEGSEETGEEAHVGPS
jgi:hypothetical protein